MKMRKWLAALLILAMIPHVQCSKKRAQRPDNPGGEPKVTFKQAYPPGKYVMTQIQTMSQHLTGKDLDQELSWSTTVDMMMEVSEPDLDGRKTIKMGFTRWQADQGGILIDTDDPPVRSMGAALGTETARRTMDKLYRALLEAQLTIEIDAQGKVTKVTGIEEMFDAVARAVPEAPDALTPFNRAYSMS